MIKISSFYPFASLLRITHEFHEEKAHVKMKSLMFEREFEFEYKDVGEISDRFYANSSQVSFGFWLLLAIASILVLFCSSIYAKSVLLRVAQILYVGGLFLYFTGFIKSWWIYISDKNDQILAYTKQTRQNRDLIPQVIELIKNKSENVQEISAATPFPEENAVFEHVYYDIPEFIRTTDRFYENELIGFEKGVYRENVYNVKYSQLNGKVYHEKAGSDVMGFALSITIPIMSIMAGFMYGFGPELGITFPRYFSYFLVAILALSFLSWPLGFLKREVIGLYGKGGNVAYWTYVNKTNKEKLEKIIEFIQSKIPPVTDNELLKEQV